MKKVLPLLLALNLIIKLGFTQGFVSGDIMLNQDFYRCDSAIGAYGTPHYDNLKSSTDSWISLNYNNQDWRLRAGMRVDLFLNSNLHNPGTPYTKAGLGRWFIEKDIKDLEISAGYLYDQIGSGIIFRSYEDRALGIDNAILGGRLKYNIKDKVTIKAIGGLQKNRFELYNPVIKAISLDGYFNLKDKVTLSPGLGAMNRTLDQKSMDIVVSTIESYDTTQRFVPHYNVYAFTTYNTLTYKGFSWYIEGVLKTQEAIRGEDGSTLVDRSGNVIYTSLAYSKKFKKWSLGMSGQFKRTQDFTLRTSPNESLLNGMLNFIPPTSRQNSLRLPARYNAATQDLQETAISFDFTVTPVKGYSFNGSYSEIRDNAFKEHYFTEYYLDFNIKKFKKVKAMLGFQYINYNQEFYTKEGPDQVLSYTPFAEISYKISKKSNLRMELQYQVAANDYGHWAYGLLEYSLSPWWTISVSDMWNVKPNLNRDDRPDKPLHYYNFYTSFTYQRHRLSLAYVRQVEGIVCTGGVCRYEPAFSGFRIGLTSSF